MPLLDRSETWGIQSRPYHHHGLPPGSIATTACASNNNNIPARRITHPRMPRQRENDPTSQQHFLSDHLPIAGDFLPNHMSATPSSTSLDLKWRDTFNGLESWTIDMDNSDNDNTQSQNSPPSHQRTHSLEPSRQSFPEPTSPMQHDFWI